MATQMKQPASSPVVTTTFESIIDMAIDSKQEGIKTFPDVSGGANPKSFGRNATTVQISLKLTHDGVNSPRTRYKSIYDRWKSNANETVELVADFGGGETITFQGLLSDLSATAQAGNATTVWIVTLAIICSSVVYS